MTRRVRPGHEAFYEQFLAGIVAAASQLPGHLGVEVFRPPSAGGEYRTVYRFESAEHLRDWLDSDEHAAWLERAEPHVIGPMRTSFVTGLESWFTLPGQPGMVPPPPYKMALLTWITIFPLITAIVAITGPLLEELPLAVRLGITTALTVPVMTWVAMPRVTRLLADGCIPANGSRTTRPSTSATASPSAGDEGLTGERCARRKPELSSNRSAGAGRVAEGVRRLAAQPRHWSCAE